MAEPEEFDVPAETQRLLDQRDAPKWASFSWVALRPLISSLNQVLTTRTPSLIPQLRKHWNEGRTDGAEHVVDRSADRGFVLLGDTGEQDRSQYVVVPVLRRVLERTPPQDRPAFGVLCSDVIYPSGDVNDYVHGFYLPYGSPAGVDDDVLGNLPMYAIPGNHDWHDGLSGFMQHFCGRERLTAEHFSWPTRLQVGRRRERVLEGVIRMLMRRPSAFRPQPLRSGEPPLDLDAMRAVRVTGIEGRRQTGSYYSIQTENVLLVAIDTGIGLGDGHSWIDEEQGAWLRAVSSRPGPKILLTGYPLVVNAERKTCWIGYPPGGAARRGHPTVNDLVEDRANGYVAVIGGDIHNFQRYRTSHAGDEDAALHHVVSGGGGAYMSATHSVTVARGRRRKLKLEAGPQPLTLIPEPQQSLQYFASLILPRLWRIQRGLALLALGLLAGAWLLPREAGAVARPFAAGVAVLTIALLLRAFTPSAWLLHERRRRWYFRVLAGAAALAGIVGALGVTWLQPAHGYRYLVAWAVLTLDGALIGWLMRRSSWWREPLTDGERLDRRTRRATIAVLLANALPALWLTGWLGGWLGGGLGGWLTSRLPERLVSWLPVVPAELTPGRRLVPLAVTVAVALAAVVTWQRRRRFGPGPGSPWRSQAPYIGYAVQGGGAFAVLTALVYPEAPLLPWAVVTGVAACAAMSALALLIASGGLWVACVVVARGAWRSQWGRWGSRGRWGFAVLLAAGLAGQLLASPDDATATSALTVLGAATVVVALVVAAPLFRWGQRGAAVGLAVTSCFVGAGTWLGYRWGTADAGHVASAFRAALGTQLTIALTVLGVFAVDWVRRVLRGHVYKLVSVLGFAVAVAVVVVADRELGWLVRGGVAGAVLVALLVMSVAWAHLTFLGVYHLAGDRDAHDEGAQLLSEEEALDFLENRSRAQPVRPGVAATRARIAAPTPDRPHGPIQAKVSEFFDTDEPPFWKHFLVVGSTRTELTIEVFVVTGEEPRGYRPAPSCTVLIDLTWAQRAPTAAPAD